MSRSGEALTEQDATLLNQAHEYLLQYGSDQRDLGNDSAADAAAASADALLRLAPRMLRATPQTAAPAAQPEPVADCVGDTRFEGWLSCHEPDRTDGRTVAYSKHDLRKAYWAGYQERGESFLRTALAASGSKVDERAAFEAWFPTEWSTTMKRRPDGTYVEPFVEDCWATWQARAAAPAEQSAAMPEGPRISELERGAILEMLSKHDAAPAAVQTKGKDDSPTWGAEQIKPPTWGHVMSAFVDGAREAKANPDAQDADFKRAADGYTKRVFEEVDPVSEAVLRTGSWRDSPSGATGHESMAVTDGGLNPYYEGTFDGESDELARLRRRLVAERDAARAVTAATPQTAAPAAQPEPVALRYRYSSKARWTLADWSPEIALDHGVEFQPLYTAAPPPAAQSDEARDAKRYRWLREQIDSGPFLALCDESGPRGAWSPTAGYCDEYVDAALAQQEPKACA